MTMAVPSMSTCCENNEPALESEVKLKNQTSACVSSFNVEMQQ